jgi:hypothetical protein
LDQFTASPGYNYELQQQQQAIQNSAAGKTGAVSGNMLQALQQNAQGLASQDYWKANQSYQTTGNNAFNAETQSALSKYGAQNQSYWDQYKALISGQGNYVSELQNLISGGQSAGANQGSQLNSLGQSVGQNIIGAGSANAAGVLGSNNALAGGLQGLMNTLMAPQGSTGGLQGLINGLSGGGGNSNMSSMINYLFGNGGTDYGTGGDYGGGGTY